MGKTIYSLDELQNEFLLANGLSTPGFVEEAGAKAIRLRSIFAASGIPFLHEVRVRKFGTDKGLFVSLLERKAHDLKDTVSARAKSVAFLGFRRIDDATFELSNVRAFGEDAPAGSAMADGVVELIQHAELGILHFNLRHHAASALTDPGTKIDLQQLARAAQPIP